MSAVFIGLQGNREVLRTPKKTIKLLLKQIQPMLYTLMRVHQYINILIFVVDFTCYFNYATSTTLYLYRTVSLPLFPIWCYINQDLLQAPTQNIHQIWLEEHILYLPDSKSILCISQYIFGNYASIHNTNQKTEKAIHQTHVKVNTMTQ